MLNSATNNKLFKAVLHVSDLRLNHKYRCLNLKNINTRYGNRLLLELPENTMYLPAKYINVMEKYAKNLNMSTKNLYMVYEGPDTVDNSPLLVFTVEDARNDDGVDEVDGMFNDSQVF